MNDLEKLGMKVAGSEQQAEQLVRRALAVLGFRVLCESWGMYIETADGKCDVFFVEMPAFSTSWSSILGKLVACGELGIETKEDQPLGTENDSEAVKWIGYKWISNPLFGCNSLEEIMVKLDLLSCDQMGGRHVH